MGRGVSLHLSIFFCLLVMPDPDQDDAETSRGPKKPEVVYNSRVCKEAKGIMKKKLRKLDVQPRKSVRVFGKHN